MKNNMTRFVIGVFALFVSAGLSFSYDVVLKNGKVVKGTKISEDAAMIVIEDSTGIKIQLKKGNVDLDKTKAANPDLPKAAPKPPEPVKEVPKKPSRKFTKEELEKLREKYDLGAGTYSEDAANSEDEEPADEEGTGTAEAPKSDEQWTQDLSGQQSRMQQAEQAFNALAAECSKLKNITVQTHTLVDEKGNPLPIKETTEKVCGDAEQAKSLYEQSRQEYEAAARDAREQGVPVRSDE